MKKKRLLFCGITMNCAGTEKAFLSLLGEIDFSRYDVDLLLAKKEGLLLEQIPKEVNVIGGMKYADMFLLSGKNAVKTILRCFCTRPAALLSVVPYFFKILFVPKKRSFTATRMWCRLLKYFKSFNEEFGTDDVEYDAAIAFWGDRTMFYMCDKVKAGRKIAWLHFDYAHPPRDDELYLNYFRQCDYIVNVSAACHEALVKKLPEIAGKCVIMENIRSPRQLVELSLWGDSFKDRTFDGIRILSVMRICEQKGYDFIVPVLKRLLEEGYNVRWYIIGGGDEEAVVRMKVSAVDNNVADRLILLGTTDNPYAYIRDTDIFALPSRYEGKPITVEEAKMFCKPIAVTDYLSADEQLEGGKLGVIGGSGEEGIYRALKKLLDSKSLREELTLECAKRDFGNQSEINKLYAMIEDDNVNKL